jgi:cell wall-associated NlpC family hydrolase
MNNSADSWALEVIGCPWVSGARGPDAFDCWGLVSWVYANRRGMTLNPYASLDAKNLFQVNSTVTNERGFWEEIEQPEELCLVAMSKRQVIHHVGVWLSASRLVLHAMDKSSVIAQNVFSLRSSGFSTVRFYRPKP